MDVVVWDLLTASLVILLLACLGHRMQSKPRPHACPSRLFHDGDHVLVTIENLPAIVQDVDKQGRVWVRFDDGCVAWYCADDLEPQGLAKQAQALAPSTSA